MGIKLLNRYLREKCTNKSINKQHLSHFAGKRIVIDTSIYLYHFLSEFALMENMYLFISILKNYEIEPIFIFDGKTPQEKKKLVKERSQKKKDAEEKYNELLRLKKEGKVDEMNDKSVQLELEALKRQFVRLRNEDIIKVKELMDAYGVIYYDAPYEADDLCVYFVKSGMAYACISDDMDMFLYGCPYVLRNFSLLNHSVLMYDTKSILDELNIPFNHFREILILSGTDLYTYSVISPRSTMLFPSSALPDRPFNKLYVKKLCFLSIYICEVSPFELELKMDIFSGRSG